MEVIMFKVGDVVVLKSGGPAMTIKDIHELDAGNCIVCSWFNDGDDLCKGEFMEAQLDFDFSNEEDELEEGECNCEECPCEHDEVDEEFPSAATTAVHVPFVSVPDCSQCPWKYRYEWGSWQTPW